MALVVQTIISDVVFVPYERPPQPQTLWTAIPRGLLSFVSAAAVVDLKPINDDFELKLSGILPPNFGYVFADAQLMIRQDRAPDWDNECNLQLRTFFRGPSGIVSGLECHYVQEFFQSSLNIATRAMVVNNRWPTFPVIGEPGTAGVQTIFTAWNGNNTAASAGTVDYFSSWWQFDLEQIRKYPINSPQPVHAR